jgi:DNA repair protein RadC
MSIREWPEDDRPREKLINRGAENLTDTELLAIFLRTGVKGKSAIELARDLLDDFKGLRNLLYADRDRFCQHKGLGLAKYTQLHAVLELARRHLNETLMETDTFTSPREVCNFLRIWLRGREQEIFVVMFLNNRNRLITTEALFKGTIDGASVYPREVVKRALQLNAAALIIAHNHPSGVAEPSQADIAITHRLRDALQLVDIRLLDHLIIGDGECTSLNQKGVM